MHTPSHVKGNIIGLKIDDALLRKIRAEAKAEGLTRSAIIRRILLRHYQAKM